MPLASLMGACQWHHGEPGNGKFATPSGPAREPGSAGCISTGQQIDGVPRLKLVACTPPCYRYAETSADSDGASRYSLVFVASHLCSKNLQKPSRLLEVFGCCRWCSNGNAMPFFFCLSKKFVT